ncbi:hypothetical protein FALBO_10928 [Fusarium albosuccineum]|uniref:Uncharacterized protein n=1 Tax=Fusarium albosuccineum TaxID=1237068 RepID=A0A8H4P9D1_9HYPO|nr:hypothetical protein FALBO_10928 [Fusarium albosuccineum]
MSYVPVPRSVPSDDIENQKTDGKTHIPDDWHGGPHTLRPRRLELIGGWAWSIVLTLAPACFFVLAILALRLEGEPLSPYGQRIVDFTRLSPTIYPILFAALASRFFKNLARWRLEKRDGVELATLEQISGSQSLAGAVERVLFVRAHVLIGILILVTWSLSPLGRQSAARVLHKGKNITKEKGSIYFRHPLDQGSSFSGASGVARAIVNINILYTSCLIASSTQKGSPVDLWDLPKIPQWPRHLKDDFERRVDMKALAAGHDYYTSLLGVQIHGLNILPQNAQYDFTVETVYYDFDCGSFKDGISRKQLSTYMNDDLDALYNFDDASTTFGTFVASISLPNLTQIYPNIDQEPIPLSDVPPGYMLYATLDQTAIKNRGSYFTLFNCTVRPEVLDTGITCKSSNSSTSCQAARQKRVNDRYTTNSFYHLMSDVASVERSNLLSNWRTSDNAREDSFVLSPTDNYLAGDSRLFAYQDEQNWANVSLEGFSKRLTTAFNTYYEASLDPFNHTNVGFREQPPTDDLVRQSAGGSSFLKQTEGVASVQHDVYRANREWIAMLIITTACLEILAVAGAALQFFIRGPDILGFASSLTRENPHVGLLPGGTGLDGPARARASRHLKVQLSDISPKDEVGYIALKTVASPEKPAQGDDRSWRPLDAKRPYL